MGGTENDGPDITAQPGKDVDVPLLGLGNVGGGGAGGGYLSQTQSEHRHPIYCNKAHYGPVYGGGAAPRSLGIEAVARTRGNWYIGDMGGGSGDGGGNGIGITYGRWGGGRDG